MNARLSPEILSDHTARGPSEPGRETAQALRDVWQSRFGDILIEVRDGRVFVNGQAVEPAEPGTASR